jgi:polysaccharide chain length determinant protein (PEP-CTERM system associated)
MDDLRELIMVRAAAMWRRRWQGALAAWIVCVVGWAVILYLPNRYESSARIYVDSETLLRPLLKGLAVQTDLASQVDYMQRTLLSRPNLDSVIRMTDLELQATSPERREAMINGLERKITVAAEGKAKNLFSVSYEGENPALTTSVVQSLLTIFVESNLGANRSDMDQARKFIEGQILDYERQLKAAEARLANFKVANLGVLASGNYTQTVDQARGRASEIRSQIEDMKVRRESLRQEMASVSPYLDLNAGTQVYLGGEVDLETRIQEAQRTLDSLNQRYTPQHPDVIGTKRLLEGLKKLQAEEDKHPTPPRPRNRAQAVKQSMPNPVYEQLKLRLVEIEGDLVSLERRARDQEAEVHRLEQLSKTAPAIEAQYASLNRDYDVIKRNYEELVNRRESARMAQEVDAKSNKIQFKVVDPPQTPLKPSGPNRPLFMSMVLLAGLGAGCLFAFVLAQLDDTFASPVHLREAFDLPVLGAITLVATPGEQRRGWMRSASFVAACIGLIVAYVGLVVIQFGRVA